MVTLKNSVDARLAALAERLGFPAEEGEREAAAAAAEAASELQKERSSRDSKAAAAAAASAAAAAILHPLVPPRSRSPYHAP